MRILLATLTVFAALTGTAAANSNQQVMATPVIHAPCPGYPNSRGCTAEDTIYVADRHDRETLWHERGHIFDTVALTDQDRRFFARLVGMPHRAWEAPTAGDESPSERFADAYAACKMGIRARPQRVRMTGYGLVIQADGRYRRTCNAIRVLELVR